MSEAVQECQNRRMNPSDYIHFPKEALKAGMLLEVNLYIYLPQNKTVIHYLKSGEVVSEQEMQFLAKVNQANLLSPISEKDKILKMGVKGIAEALNAGNLDSPVVKKTASGLLNQINSDSNIIESLQDIQSMVQGLVSQFKKTPSVEAYDEAIKRAGANQFDPLNSHLQQVSAIAVLMAITVGNFTLDDLSDLATAGLLHDLGLKEITQNLADSHFKGSRKLSNQEKIIYIRHIDFTLDRVKRDHINITPGVKRIIEQHHENWDGTGFKNQSGNKIYRAARIFRIADEVVSLIQDHSQCSGYQSALLKLKDEVGIYDPAILDALLVLVRA